MKPQYILIACLAIAGCSLEKDTLQSEQVTSPAKQQPSETSPPLDLSPPVNLSDQQDPALKTQDNEWPDFFAKQDKEEQKISVKAKPALQPGDKLTDMPTITGGTVSVEMKLE